MTDLITKFKALGYETATSYKVSNTDKADSLIIKESSCDTEFVFSFIKNGTWFYFKGLYQDVQKVCTLLSPLFKEEELVSNSLSTALVQV